MNINPRLLIKGGAITETIHRLVPCPNVGQASINHDLRLYPGGLFFFYGDKFTSFSHSKSRLLTTIL